MNRMYKENCHLGEDHSDPSFGEGYAPTKDDIESAYRAIALSGTEVPIDDVFDRVEKDAAHAGIILEEGWREKCEEKLPQWSKESWEN